MTPGTASAGVEHTLRELARRLEEEIDELVATMLPRMRAEVPDFDVGSRPELRDAERASIYGNIRAVLGPSGATASSPTRPRKRWRKRGSPLVPACRSRRCSTPIALGMRSSGSGPSTRRRARLDARSRHAVLRIGSHWLFGYVDAIARQVTKEYIRERDRIMRSSIERRVQLVRDILDGATIDVGELGYDLEVEHLRSSSRGPRPRPGWTSCQASSTAAC